MIDTTSIESLAGSLPIAPPEVEWALSFKMRLAEAISPATASLAQRGYLGCLPIAHNVADEFVLRLLPNQALADSTVAIAWWSDVEGLTIAPALGQFVAGRAAERLTMVRKGQKLGLGTPDIDLDTDVEQQLAQLAAELGDTGSIRAVLTAEQSLDATDESVPLGHLWGVIDPENPLCAALVAAWSFEGRELGTWLSDAFQRMPEIDIARRLYIAYHTTYKTGQDVTEVAWQLIEGDQVFDVSILATSTLPRVGSWRAGAQVKAVKWLQSQSIREIQVPASLWQAAQAFAADPLSYDGSQHLAAAKEMAAHHPTEAYTQAANAACFYARATERTPKEAIVFAHQLALENDWQDLQTVLGWAREEMGF